MRKYHIAKTNNDAKFLKDDLEMSDIIKNYINKKSVYEEMFSYQSIFQLKNNLPCFVPQCTLNAKQKLKDGDVVDNIYYSDGSMNIDGAPYRSQIYDSEENCFCGIEDFTNIYGFDIDIENVSNKYKLSKDDTISIKSDIDIIIEKLSYLSFFIYRSISKTGIHLFMDSGIHNKPKDADDWKKTRMLLATYLQYELKNIIDLNYKYSVDEGAKDITRLFKLNEDKNYYFNTTIISPYLIPELSDEYDIALQKKTNNEKTIFKNTKKTYKEIEKTIIYETDLHSDFNFNIDYLDKYDNELRNFFQKNNAGYSATIKTFAALVKMNDTQLLFINEVYRRYMLSNTPGFLEAMTSSPHSIREYIREKQGTMTTGYWRYIFKGCEVPYLDPLIVIKHKSRTSNKKEEEIILDSGEKLSDQIDIVNNIIDNNQLVILDAGAGLGKTWWSRLYIEDREMNVLFLATKRMLLRQVYNDFKKYNINKPLYRNWSYPHNLVEYSEDFDKYTDDIEFKKSNIFISTLRSAEKIKEKIDIIFVDESHLLGSSMEYKENERSFIEDNIKRGTKIVFMTATPKRTLLALSLHNHVHLKVYKKEDKPKVRFLKTRNQYNTIVNQSMMNNILNAKAGVIIFRNNKNELENIKKEINFRKPERKVKIVNSETDNTNILTRNVLEYDTIYLVTSVISEGINILNNNENWILLLAPNISNGIDVELMYQFVKRFRDASIKTDINIIGAPIKINSEDEDIYQKLSLENFNRYDEFSQKYNIANEMLIDGYSDVVDTINVIENDKKEKYIDTFAISETVYSKEVEYTSKIYSRLLKALEYYFDVYEEKIIQVTNNDENIKLKNIDFEKLQIVFENLYVDNSLKIPKYSAYNVYLKDFYTKSSIENKIIKIIRERFIILNTLSDYSTITDTMIDSMFVSNSRSFYKNISIERLKAIEKGMKDKESSETMKVIKTFKIFLSTNDKTNEDLKSFAVKHIDGRIKFSYIDFKKAFTKAKRKQIKSERKNYLVWKK